MCGGVRREARKAAGRGIAKEGLPDDLFSQTLLLCGPRLNFLDGMLLRSYAGGRSLVRLMMVVGKRVLLTAEIVGCRQ